MPQLQATLGPTRPGVASCGRLNQGQTANLLVRLLVPRETDIAAPPFHVKQPVPGRRQVLLGALAAGTREFSCHQR